MWKSTRKATMMLIIALFFVFLPLSANAYTVYLSSFQSGYGSTGEILGTASGNPTFFLCMEHDVNVQVPGTYYARDLTLSGQLQLKAAWLMDQYAPSLRGAYNGNSLLATGVGVQSAVWSVLTGTLYGDSTVQAIANAMLTTLPGTIDGSTASYLQSHYAYVDLYTNANLTGPVQDLIRPVPIPAAAWLLGSGLFGLVVIRRRFRK